MANPRFSRRLPALAGALAVFSLAGLARAQTAPPPAIKAGPCGSPEARQFDFWVGDWEVFTADGKLAGTNRIERILGGCVLLENWSGAKGTDGKSFNMYSEADKKWRQTWVDSQGTRLDLTGELIDGRMVLEGDSPSAAGNPVRNRITWEKLPDGRVRQHWEVSGDGGLKWTDAFVGIYKSKAKAKPAAKGSSR